jgi:hypothetical protein
MSTSQKAKKVLLALGISKISPAQVIANSEHYVLCMTGNAHFPSPSPTLAAVSAQTTVLQNAYTLSLQRTKGSVSAMHVQLDALKLLLKSLVSYVEGIANADPVNAVEIAQSSGIPEKKAAVHTPKTFSVKLGKVKGSVMLNTKAVKGGVYIYQMTTDPNNAAS